jgi:DeoR family transcriptional regulator, suf operon transcriptional repressor
MPGSEPSVSGQLPHRELPIDRPVDGSSLRRSIVLRLRRAGPSSPDQLAAALGVSRTGILQQLRSLESAQLVARRTVRHGVGRPRHVYDETPDAQDLFPTNYDGLAVGLLAAIGAVGGDTLVDDVLTARRRQIGARVRERFDERLPASASLVERVVELARFQDDLGYLCEAGMEADGELRLREHNCAIYHIASNEPAACRAELALFRDVLGANVVRETHIVAGDRSCTYLIRE